MLGLSVMLVYIHVLIFLVMTPRNYVLGWRWRQYGPPKRWHPTTTLHGLTTQKPWTWISIQSPLISPWRWRQYGSPKFSYPTTTLHDVTTQQTTIWIFIALKTSNVTSCVRCWEFCFRYQFITNFVSCTVRVRNTLSRFEGGTHTEGFWELSIEEDIWT
jgi:hypothetical protein